MKKIAIVIPNHKSHINEEEIISLKSAKKHFIKYDKFFLIPGNLELDFDISGFDIKKIDPTYFSTYLKYNEFLVNKKFYEIFLDYDYILIYQLDCLFFQAESELEKFIFYDFIGPPHINIRKKRFTGTMNGGFSLRRIDSCIEALESKKFNLLNFKYVQIRHFLSIKRSIRLVSFLTKVFIQFLLKKIFKREKVSFSKLFFQNFSKYFNEDVFWSLFVNLFKKDFKLPGFKQASSFGFDKDPKIMFELNSQKLPLGCHCWYKDGNRLFWDKYI